jgi:DnaK suppressor protein
MSQAPQNDFGYSLAKNVPVGLNRESEMNIQNYKRVLIAKAAELRHSKISKDEIAIERNPELLDEIQRTADREIAMTFLTRDWHTSALVSEALARIDSGEFGICAECDGPVSEARLKAIPWAKFCIRCQEESDRKADLQVLSEAA